eukprot:3301905-Prymnesium_polylepis.1
MVDSAPTRSNLRYWRVCVRRASRAWHPAQRRRVRASGVCPVGAAVLHFVSSVTRRRRGWDGM